MEMLLIGLAIVLGIILLAVVDGILTRRNK